MDATLVALILGLFSAITLVAANMSVKVGTDIPSAALAAGLVLMQFGG